MIVPWHPLAGIYLDLSTVPLHRDQVVEGIGALQFAGVDDGHEKVSDARSVFGFVEE